jgi:hypothetical protein
MPRKPTGRPRGRPAGTGQLDNPKRITVWLRGETYDKLESYADGRHFHRGEPQLASCMRELLEHALACPYKNQTQNIPVLHGNINRPIENIPPAPQNNYEQIETITAVPENNYYEQIESVPLVTENISRQIENVPVVAENNNGQIETVPPYDTATRRLSDKLCPRGHDYRGTGKSLLSRRNNGCLECEREKSREKREAKRQALAP